MKKPLFLSIVFLLPSLVLADGNSTAQFLELGGGARTIAMGEAGVALGQDANALHWNPAHLGKLKRPSLSFMYGAYVESTNFQFLASAYPTKKAGSFGFTLQNFSAGSIRQTDQNAQVIGDFSPRDTALTLGWGRTYWKNWTLGLSGKFIYSKIINSAQTGAADAGLTWNHEKVQFGAAVRNLGGQLTFDQESNHLPLSYHLGSVYRLRKNLLVSLEGVHERSADYYFSSGTELDIKLSDSFVSFRGGYSTRTRDIPGIGGLSLGAGWRRAPLQIDYAWVPFGNVSQTHRFSFTFAFGGAQASPKPRRSIRRGTPPKRKFKKGEKIKWITPEVIVVPEGDPESR